MTTPGGFDPRYDPTAPTYETPSYETPSYETPTYETPSYETPSPSFQKPSAESPSSAWPPPEPADTSGSGWFLAPPSVSALPPLPGEPDFRPDAAYQPGPMYQPGPVGPRRSSQRAAIAIVLGTVVVLALAVVGVGLVFRSGSDDRRAASPVLPTSSRTVTPPTGSGTGNATGTTTPSGPGTPSGAAEVTVPAVTPGFQGALSPKENVAYDVPTGWEIRTPGTLVGFEDDDGKPVAIMHGVSTYRRDACSGVSGSNRGNAGFATAGTLEPAQAAQNGVRVFAEAAALNEDGSTAPVEFGPVVGVTVGGGAIAATMATATVTPPSDASCGAPRVVFTAVAFRTAGGATALFIMYLDQGTPDALSTTLAQQIIASLRPYPS